MGLDPSKLEKIKNKAGYTIARCPACAENGHDRKGEHLRIESNGRFGCVIFPGESGKEHRKRIFQLTGLHEQVKVSFTDYPVINNAHNNPPKILIKNILGRLGRVSEPHAQNLLEPPIIDIFLKSCQNGVPSVPEPPTMSALGHLGRVSEPHSQNFPEPPIIDISLNSCQNGVPSVPEPPTMSALGRLGRFSEPHAQNIPEPEPPKTTLSRNTMSGLGHLGRVSVLDKTLSGECVKKLYHLGLEWNKGLKK